MSKSTRLVSSLEIAAGSALLAVAVITVVMVLLRKIFSASIPDWFDLSRLLQAIAITWGISLAAIEGGHICVDLIWEKSGAAWRRRMEVFAGAIELVFYGAFAVMFFVAVQMAADKGLVTQELRLPVWPFYGLAAVGSVVALLAPILVFRRGSQGRQPVEEQA